MTDIYRILIEQPVFNLLELIYAMLPGHDLGITIIIFTIIIRLLLWPIVKRQLHQAKAMRKLQPELKKLKKAAAGDRQKEARLQMELYKEHGVKPFATFGTILIQLPIFVALYFSVKNIIGNPQSLQTFAYEPIKNLDYIQSLAAGTAQLEHSLLGVVDLSRKAIESGGLYMPALIIAIAAAIAQFYQTKLMLPNDQDAKKLSDIMHDAAKGKQADQSDVSAAVSRTMLYVLPFFTFIFAVSVPSALSLYILTTSLVGYAQQAYVLRQDEEEMHDIASEPEKPKTKKKSKTTKKKPSNKKKRRKK